MKKAREVYDYIMKSTPRINANSSFFDKKFWNSHITDSPFEQRVWRICEPDKDLANQVIEIAQKEMEVNKMDILKIKYEKLFSQNSKFGATKLKNRLTKCFTAPSDPITFKAIYDALIQKIGREKALIFFSNIDPTKK